MQKWYIITLAIILGLWRSLVYAQDDIIYLNSALLRPHERPLVKFTHAKHSQNIKCVTCHHNYDQYFNLIDDNEGVPCHECHKVSETTKNLTTLTVAFHRQCKTCHKQAIKQGKSKPPIMCAECHFIN